MSDDTTPDTTPVATAADDYWSSGAAEADTAAWLASQIYVTSVGTMTPELFDDYVAAIASDM